LNTIKEIDMTKIIRPIFYGVFFAIFLVPAFFATAKTIQRPPQVHLNVRDFGATGNGTTKDTKAIQEALDRCWVLGGGEVFVPTGRYLTGGISLKSNTTLRFEKGATLVGSPDFADYAVTQVRWEGKWIQGYTALISAFDARNIRIVGEGFVSGDLNLHGRPNKENPLRRPSLIEMVGCTGIVLEDFSTEYRGMWSIHLTYCENVSIKKLNIHSTGGNGDGIDLDSDRHIKIDSCTIVTGDDCISLKSGRGMEGNTIARPTEDVVITNCTFQDSLYACIGIGSETSGGIRNATIRHCTFTYAKSYALYIKSRPGRGAFIENITADDLDVSGMQEGFLRINMLNSGLQDQVPVPGKDGIPTIKNFKFSHIHVTGVPILVHGSGITPDKPLEGFTLTDVTGTCAKGMTFANVNKIELRNIRVTGFVGHLLSISNVHGKGLKGAVTVDAPKFPDPVPESAVPYTLQ
jgi:polygalacturonase